MSNARFWRVRKLCHSIYRKYKNSFPGGLSPESGIVVQAR